MNEGEESSKGSNETTDKGQDALDSSVSLEDLKKAKAAATEAGARRGVQSFLAELGVTKDELSAVLKERDDRQAAAKSAEERAAEAVAQLALAQQEAAQARFASQVSEVLTAALLATPKDDQGNPIQGQSGLNPDRLTLALRVAEVNATSQDDLADAVAAAVDALRKESPEWFSKSGSTSTGDTGRSTENKGDGGTARGGNSGSGVEAALAAYRKARDDRLSPTTSKLARLGRPS